MIGGLFKLEHTMPIAPIPVAFPNRASEAVSLQWSMSLSPKINFDKVFYIPKFSCNLIDVAQLIRELKYIVIFDDDLCLIEDRISRSLTVVLN